MGVLQSPRKWVITYNWKQERDALQRPRKLVIKKRNYFFQVKSGISFNSGTRQVKLGTSQIKSETSAWKSGTSQIRNKSSHEYVMLSKEKVKSGTIQIKSNTKQENSGMNQVKSEMSQEGYRRLYKFREGCRRLEKVVDVNRTS